ncbi:hypothetical protein DCS_05794 [Drechmeria coniospora]|uniref:Uncharacterized protein n=1 Tax=Drechmeria coniospora TaxID=98403 RepID=A0A151GNV6_DRECN|nr:hypothetical protein DCS_05794 [Drechmeria coniospora]KYK58776.1 hypothetical protein DCS_05794 [Drechmeria coniospora]
MRSSASRLIGSERGEQRRAACFFLPRGHVASTARPVPPAPDQRRHGSSPLFARQATPTPPHALVIPSSVSARISVGNCTHAPAASPYPRVSQGSSEAAAAGRFGPGVSLVKQMQPAQDTFETPSSVRLALAKGWLSHCAEVGQGIGQVVGVALHAIAHRPALRVSCQLDAALRISRRWVLVTPRAR